MDIALRRPQENSDPNDGLGRSELVVRVFAAGSTP